MTEKTWLWALSTNGQESLRRITAQSSEFAKQAERLRESLISTWGMSVTLEQQSKLKPILLSESEKLISRAQILYDTLTSLRTSLWEMRTAILQCDTEDKKLSSNLKSQDMRKHDGTDRSTEESSFYPHPWYASCTEYGDRPGSTCSFGIPGCNCKDRSGYSY